MADEERRPLLPHANPTWNQRRNTSSISSADSNTISQPHIYHKSSVNDKGKTFELKERSRLQVRFALASIILAVVLERLSFYGLTGNLVLFLNENPYHWESYHAVSATFLFFGISYVMSLIGGWISDSLLGRFRALLFAYGIYICGFVMLPFLALGNNYTNISLPSICMSETPNERDMPDNLFKEPCAWLIFITLIVIAAAAGMFKANICPFGADQLVQASQQTQLSFFNLFYWSVNFGSFLGLGVIAYIEQQESFRTGFIVCAVSLGCSAVIFIAGRCCYISRQPDGSVLTNIFKIFQEAWRKKRQRRQLYRDLKNAERSDSGFDEAQPVSAKISFLDHAKLSHGGIFHNSLVDDVKKLGMIFVVFAVFIPYWLVYFQMQTTFLFQALHMKLNLASINWTVKEIIVVSNETFPAFPIDTPDNTFKFVAAWLTLFDAVIVIILLPLFDRVIYPRMARAGHPFTFGKRIVLGMLFAMASMVAAGIVELFRLKAYWPDDDSCVSRVITQKIGDTYYYAADMSVLWQIPQYTLIGISEVFGSVASLQFAVTIAPKSMKALVTGLFYFFSGISSFLGIAIVLILAKTNTWFQSMDYGNINCKAGCPMNNTDSPGDCHLDYYFYSLAGWEALGLILFFIVAKVFHLTSDEPIIPVRTKERGNRHVQTQISGSSSTPS